MWVDDLADYVQANGISVEVTTAGVPDSVNELVTLTPAPGFAPISQHDAAVGTRRPNVQIMCRSLSFPTAFDRATLIYDLVSGVVNAVIGSTRFLRIAPLQEPFYLGRDEKDREMVAFNCAVQRA